MHPNLATKLNGSGIFTMYSLIISNPVGPVSITATNTLVIGNGIDLSGASQDLTINTPLFVGGQQGCSRHFWTVTNTRTLTVNGRVDGVADLIIAGGGSVALGGTNTYTGTTSINAGTLTISGAGQLGAGNYASAITDNGVFIYNSSLSQTLSGNFSGTGSVTVNGPGTLTLAGTNTCTGNTTINGGTLALGSSLGGTNVTLAGGATFDVSGLSPTFVLGSGSMLMNSSVGATINGTNNCSLGTLSLVTDGTNAAIIQTNGTMTISASTVIRVNNTGRILGVGNHPIIAAATAGNPGLVVGTLPSVVVTGNGVAGSATLQINGSGGLDLVVTSTTSSNPTSVNVAYSSGILTLTWPGDHLGWLAQSNALDLTSSNDWFDILGSQSATNLLIPINPASPQIFYRLRYPF